MCRVGQNHIYTPYMTVYLVISLPKSPYTAQRCNHSAPLKKVFSFANLHQIRTPFNFIIVLSAQICRAKQPLTWPKTLQLLHYMHGNVFI